MSKRKHFIPKCVRKAFEEKETITKVCDNLLRHPSIKLFADYKKLEIDILKAKK